MSTHFGEHVMIDGYRGSKDKLDNEALVRSCLEELPRELGMHPLSEPVVYQAPDNQIKDPGGWSGFVVVMESHVSLHTFPLRGFVSADVYTCRNGMDVKKIEAYFKEKFDLEELEVNFVQRGKRYPSANIY